MKLILGFLMVLLALPLELAHATLGESESSVSHVRVAFHASAAEPKVVSNLKYHEINSNGITVHEYVGSDGVVYAVTWSGMSQPELSVLLGSHYNEFVAAEKQRPRNKVFREATTTSTSSMIVVRGGHMRDIRGKAYLPDRLPSGVRPEDLE